MRYALGMVAVCLATTTGPAKAGDFRIETNVYGPEKDGKPISRNLTLFQAGVVYDFLTDPETVTIFRPPTDATPGRFIVLDPARSVKMEVTTDQIERLLDKLQDWAAEQSDPFVRFLGQPDFAESAAEGNETVVLTSRYMTYRIRAMKAADDASLAAYRQFSDWYARFNARGGMLPFPRLAVNEVLFRERLIPVEVMLQIPGQGVDLRTEHRTGWLLSKQDRQRIDEAQRQVASFRELPAEAFLHDRDVSGLQ